jgi:hypothetical protein
MSNSWFSNFAFKSLIKFGVSEKKIYIKEITDNTVNMFIARFVFSSVWVIWNSLNHERVPNRMTGADCTGISYTDIQNKECIVWSSHKVSHPNIQNKERIIWKSHKVSHPNIQNKEGIILRSHKVSHPNIQNKEGINGVLTRPHIQTSRIRSA